MNRALLFFSVFMLSSCGSDLKGAYVDSAGNSWVFKQDGKVTFHTAGADKEYDYKEEGEKITVLNSKNKEGYRVVEFFRVQGGESIQSLGGVVFLRKESDHDK
jgi:hypothetical protein